MIKKNDYNDIYNTIENDIIDSLLFFQNEYKTEDYEEIKQIIIDTVQTLVNDIFNDGD